jgi:hypothetical protein
MSDPNTLPPGANPRAAPSIAGRIAPPAPAADTSATPAEQPPQLPSVGAIDGPVAYPPQTAAARSVPEPFAQAFSEPPAPMPDWYEDAGDEYHDVRDEVEEAAQKASAALSQKADTVGGSIRDFGRRLWAGAKSLTWLAWTLIIGGLLVIVLWMSGVELSTASLPSAPWASSLEVDTKVAKARSDLSRRITDAQTDIYAHVGSGDALLASKADLETVRAQLADLQAKVAKLAEQSTKPSVPTAQGHRRR